MQIKLCSNFSTLKDFCQNWKIKSQVLQCCRMYFPIRFHNFISEHKFRFNLAGVSCSSVQYVLGADGIGVLVGGKYAQNKSDRKKFVIDFYYGFKCFHFLNGTPGTPMSRQ